MIKHATGLFNETSDELISVLRLDNADSVLGQWDMSELCDFVYRCSLETVFAVVTEQRLGVLRSVPAVGGNISNQTEEDVNTNRQYITLSSQFKKTAFMFLLEENPAFARGIVKDEKALKSHILQVQHLSISST